MGTEAVLCVCVCVLDGDGSWVLASTALVVVILMDGHVSDWLLSLSDLYHFHHVVDITLL